MKKRTCDVCKTAIVGDYLKVCLVKHSETEVGRPTFQLLHKGDMCLECWNGGLRKVVADG